MRTAFFLTALVIMAMTNMAHADTGPANDTYEARAVQAFLLDCLPPLAVGDTVKHIAEMQKLPELSPEAEKSFLQKQSGKVYGLPSVGGGIVLTARDFPICEVIIQKVDAAEFMKQVDYWFDPKHSPFKVEENKTLTDGEINRRYSTTMKDAHLVLLVKVRQHAIDGGMQAMLTAGRTDSP